MTTQDDDKNLKELEKIIEQARYYQELGQHEMAIQLLRDHPGAAQLLMERYVECGQLENVLDRRSKELRINTKYLFAAAAFAFITNTFFYSFLDATLEENVRLQNTTQTKNAQIKAMMNEVALAGNALDTCLIFDTAAHGVSYSADISPGQDTPTEYDPKNYDPYFLNRLLENAVRYP